MFRFPFQFWFECCLHGLGIEYFSRFWKLAVLDFSFELGRATPLTKHMARNERVLQTPQHVANINIQIYPDNENQQEKLKRINNNNNNTSSNYLKITNVYGSLITNKTYYQKKKYPDGSTFYMQYKTISIEHSCPSGGWFPKLWKEGINGKYGRVTLVRFKLKDKTFFYFSRWVIYYNVV